MKKYILLISHIPVPLLYPVDRKDFEHESSIAAAKLLHYLRVFGLFYCQKVQLIEITLGKEFNLLKFNPINGYIMLVFETVHFVLCGYSPQLK